LCKPASIFEGTQYDNLEEFDAETPKGAGNHDSPDLNPYPKAKPNCPPKGVGDHDSPRLQPKRDLAIELQGLAPLEGTEEGTEEGTSLHEHDHELPS